MSAHPLARPKPRSRKQTRAALGIVAALVLVGVMAWNTKVVKTGADGAGAVPGVFVPTQYGQATFPKVQAAVADKAVEAATLAEAIAKDPAAAAKQYGVPAGEATEYAVKLTGTAGKNDLGVYDLQVPGLPDGFAVQVQTGPAINGTDLRDATGTIAFGQFVNQIDYQNAGAALNKEMKKQVLAKIDAGALSGKTLSIIGAFRAASDPKAWLVTPVRLDVR